MMMDMVTLDKIVNLSKRRGFIFQGSEIYGGLANTWDFGPLGVELKNNIKKLWWKMFVQERDDMVGLDAGIIMNSKVWEASGHMVNFNDLLIECKHCKRRFRADDDIFDGKLNLKPLNKERGLKGAVLSSGIETDNLTCPECSKKGFSDPKRFNTMFRTNLGPVEALENQVYLRPETAQAIFVDFKQILETMRMRIPFGVAQIGKAFRNEITPGNFVFRTREFEQMEIEYFVREKDWKKSFEYWLAEMKRWIKAVGIDEKKVKYVEVADGERAHYSKRTMDVEFEYPFGQKELYGLAYRTDFDLKAHQKHSGRDLEYRDPETGEKFIPHVIEPSLGVERTVLAVLLSCYEEVKGGRTTTTESAKDVEVVLKLNKNIAPVKVAVLPLSRKPELVTAAKLAFDKLKSYFVCQYDEVASIGRRYRRQDEIGTPYCVTVDFESLEDKKVTVRDRDTMKQERVEIGKLAEYLQENLEK